MVPWFPGFRGPSAGHQQRANLPGEASSAAPGLPRAVRPLVLVSRADPASVSIRDALLGMRAWREVGVFQGLPVRAHGEFLLAEVEPLHLECDLVDRALRQAGFDFDALLFASKHRAESGKPALTVHPIGNYGQADHGGVPGRVSPTPPLLVSRILRRLHAEVQGTRHAATLEATHHGPYVETPACFVEVGTDEAAWTDPGLASRVARAILASTEPTAGDAAPTLVWLGGSHYAPRAGDLVKASRLNVGHVVPGYALDRGVSPEALLDAVRGTPGCQGYFLDRSLPEPPKVALEVFGALELGWWKDEDLP